MIQGLKVQVNAQELKGLCVARAAYHASRAKHYTEQLGTLRNFDNPNSSMQPGRECQQKIDGHNAQAAELAFIAEHLVEGETYQLDQSDLGKLGISYLGY